MSERLSEPDKRGPLATGSEADLLAAYVADPGSLNDEQIEALRERVSRDPELAQSIALLKEIGRPEGDERSELTVDELKADWRKLRARRRFRPPRTQMRRLAAGLALAAVGLAASWVLVGRFWAGSEPVVVELYAEDPARRSLDPGGPAPRVGLVEMGTPSTVFVLNALVPPGHDGYRTQIFPLGEAERLLVGQADGLDREPDGTWRLAVSTGDLPAGLYRITLHAAGPAAEAAPLASFLFRVVTDPSAAG